MFDIPFSELFIIAAIALIVLGPQHLPEVARTVGGFIRRVRRFLDNVKEDLGNELKVEELDEFRRLRDELAETKQWVRQSSHDTVNSLMDETRTTPAADPPRRRRRPRRRSPAVKRPDGQGKDTV